MYQYNLSVSATVRVHATRHYEVVIHTQLTQFLFYYRDHSPSVAEKI